jgi:hypothetical protein
MSSTKRKRGDFELNVEGSVDVVAKGLVSLADAEVYFGAFFQGCVSCLLSIWKAAAWPDVGHRKG